MMRILGIETSCDETGVAIVEKKGEHLRVVKNLIASQIPLHRKTGGVVPEVAARAHLEKLLPMVRECLGKNNWRTGRGIDAIAVTSGPGLITALLVGVETAKTFALLWKKPIMGINHMTGHIYASLLEKKDSVQPKWQFPVLALVVSGGHTELILIKKHLSFQKLGATVDDAAGEAFDKVAKILGLPYPGGPIVSRMAETGNPTSFEFPRPMIQSKDYHFSFSGLKTAVLYAVTNQKLRIKHKGVIVDVCASFQQAAVDVLVSKTLRAAKEYKVSTVCLVGGVASNTLLRETLKTRIATLDDAPQFLVPERKYCVDNAAMIAAVGCATFSQQKKSKKQLLKTFDWKKVEADSRWEL
ncbi:MAG TPA: tRNA (adenosine(37)-N6)-threonylcarbamoyltransferase complex transferase subunit TsaD [Patescibacteria group bacterium]|nr:tRNA (adenosine(37)-N6)-threonylcarbamoyltransferase complex transferase subunit TsaD [Patescibacteria group bacterium]